MSISVIMFTLLGIFLHGKSYATLHGRHSEFAVEEVLTTSHTVKVSWTSVSGAAGYLARIDCELGDNYWNVTQVLSLPNNANSATFTDLKPDTRYDVFVCTVDEHGNYGNSKGNVMVKTPRENWIAGR